jgi:hypothetical protein
VLTAVSSREAARAAAAREVAGFTPSTSASSRPTMPRPPPPIAAPAPRPRLVLTREVSRRALSSKSHARFMPRASALTPARRVRRTLAGVPLTTD